MLAIKYLEAWNQTMSTKAEEPLASLLHDSFHMHSPRHGESTPKEEHLKWCVNEGPDSIGDFKVLYEANGVMVCLLYTSPSPRDRSLSRMPSSA